MGKREKPPGEYAAGILNWRARQIEDPVERLKFLRQASTQAAGIESRLPRHKKMVLSAVAALAAASGVATLAPKLSSMARKPAADPVLAATRNGAAPAYRDVVPDVWLVEKTPQFEAYSNGLRIEVEGAVMHSPRQYLRLDRKHPETWKNAGVRTNFETAPVGIVFHTTESDVLPFERSQNNNLKRLATNVLSYVRSIRAYHYLVDRFGRVHRVVSEESVANHAGWSVWADTESVYVNLNQSFLAISFEAQTRPQDGSETINSAQVHAARVLTDMLRNKYKIKAENCTTHAQVSVNPDNWLIGAHTDWSTNFPYEEMGLPVNYAKPIPAMTIFGFSYDPVYVKVSEARLWRGLLLADEEVRQEANAKKLKPALYKALLNQRYRETVEALHLK